MKKIFIYIFIATFAIVQSVDFANAAQNAQPQPPGHPKKCVIPPEEMKKIKADLDNALKLTPSQKEFAKQNHEKGRAEIEPIMKELKAKHAEARQIRKNWFLTPAQKEKKIEAKRAQMRALKKQADDIRTANMEAFEAILTPAQKKVFATHKAYMQKRCPKP